ncbi:hypothetical protein J2I47_04525 [Fibrella sp. HMF5335]|uniref:Uncharacterized protein n=1 Tax=Fibrella rubiginis TaxID=2817060 RepID=A0A939GG02_9BACT|nr:DUF6544 family protein [Fibrella rubiginis]MBO0935807.1 hypothetical protein [Fibrella rubiginis]
MFRYLFAFLLLTHGLIHLMGFVSQWHLTVTTPMTGKTLIPISADVGTLLTRLWLVTCLGFLLALVGYLLRHEGWLAVTACSVSLSQVLIIIYWPDAKAGTLVNVFIATVLGLTYARTHFDQTTDEEAREVLAQPAVRQEVVTEKMLTGLPTPVQQWLTASGVVGHERIHTVRLRQRGLMRTSPNGNWMPTSAEQYFSVDRPGFVWKADVRMMRFLPLAGRDKYVDGRGNMLIKALSVVPVVDAADAKTDQGTLLRYLGEICWFPAAALSPYIAWQPIDDTHAQATMTYKGVTARATFAFDAQHRLVSVSALRYMGGGNKGTLQQWYIPSHAWKTLHGVTIPVKGDVTWQLPTGDFTYYQWEITDIDYNVHDLY